MRKGFIRAIMLSVFLGLCLLVSAMEEEDSSGVFFSPMLSTWGLGVVVGYRCADLMVPGTATSVFAGTEGGYFYGTYYRLPDGTVFSGTRGAFSPDDVGFNYWMVEWKSGLKQGFLSKGGHDFLGLELIYTGDWRHHVENEGALLFASSVPEKEGLLMHELRVSVFADYVLPHILHQYKEGMGAEVWFRMVPPGMGEGSGGTVSYYGVGGETKASFTVYDSDPEGDEFCVVLVTHALFEHMWGEHVPFFELGYATEYLRGVDGQGLDTPNSGVANAELRFYLPSPGLAFNLTIWPVLYVFSDNGYFWDEAFEEGVFVSSAGLGCALELAPVGVLSLSTQWRLTDTNVDGTRWSPLYLSLGSYLF